ncbi:hypothetical protein TRVA0_019S00144 [Trichomonascus vanleenenianus]|uniref:C97 family peptidase n=1 Tax=Trichomonascus vanleenenianus TaxID=2268995 RepID=UPI003ECAAA04
MSEEETFPVKLYVYDLSRGMASAMSEGLLGFRLEGIWHSSIVLNNVEIYYGQGIQQSIPGMTHHGPPLRVVDLGETSIPMEVVREYLNELQEEFAPHKYDLFDHNCNHFSDHLSDFLLGKNIPEYISSLPQTVLQTPFGQMLRPMIEQAMRPAVQGSTANATSL